MKRRSHRPERVSELIRQAVGAFLTGDVRDPRIGFVTVTGVDVSPDLSHANVRVSVMGSDEEKATSLEGLASAARFLRAQLSKELHLRTMAGASLDVHRVHTGEPRTIVPERAEASLSVRLAGGQRSAEMRASPSSGSDAARAVNPSAASRPIQPPGARSAKRMAIAISVTGMIASLHHIGMPPASRSGLARSASISRNEA